MFANKRSHVLIFFFFREKRKWKNTDLICKVINLWKRNILVVPIIMESLGSMPEILECCEDVDGEKMRILAVTKFPVITISKHLVYEGN